MNGAGGGIGSVSGRYQTGKHGIDTRTRSTDDPPVRIGVLGPLTVAGDGPPLAPRDRVVLAALVVGRGGVVGADTLADARWNGSGPPASWSKVIQGCVVRIRKSVGVASIETDGKGYRLVAPPDDIDARRFELSLARARELLSTGEPDRAMYAADEALALWRGRPLPELDDWEPGRIEATRLAELQLDAEELRIEAALRAGRHREVLADASAAVAREPLREHRWAVLALAQHQAGRQGDALRTLHEARKVLVRQLGVDPGDEIVALEAAILRQDPTLVAPRLGQPSELCPFRGLAAYEAADADRYFGRAGEVDECLARLRVSGVLAVVGPSGSGKSSLLRAGITPALERAGHRVELITPGVHPLHALESIDTRRAGAVAVVVDQCEEAVTLCVDAGERRRFFDALVDRSAQGPVLIGLRADRLGELTRHAAFAALVERGLYLLTPMNTAQLREAIEAPARQAGLLFEAGLVDLLLRDVEDEPGSLPLLSHALVQTWQAREGNVLTVAGYRAAGGIRGAVAQSAEHLYEHVPAEQRLKLRDLMLRLVAPSTDGEPTRARVPLRIAAPDADRQQLLDDLVQARLVTTDAEPDGASVELAHEALVRAWPRLKDWLDDDAEGQRIWRHLASTAESWDAMGRPESELYRGTRLARAIEWSTQSAADLHPTERDFLESSARLAEAERSALAREAHRHAKANRRLRLVVATIAVLAMLAASAAVLAWRQAARADHESAVARSHELATAAVGAIADSPALAKTLAVAAADAETGPPTPAAVAALHRSFAADATVARWGFVGEVGYVTADIDDAGARLAAAGIFQPDRAGWTLSVADVASSETLWSLDLSQTGAASAALAEPLFTAGGKQVVVGVYWDPSSWRRPPIAFDGVDEPPSGLLGAQVRDAATGDLVEVIDLGRCGGVVSGVSDTHLVVRTLHGDDAVMRECRWDDGTIGVELVERATGQRTVLTTKTDAPWHLGAALSDDGSTVAYDTIGASADGPTHEVVVADVATGAELRRIAGRGVRDLDRSGDRLLTGWHEAQVWDIAAGRVLATVDVARRGSNADSRFGPDARTVVSSSDDATLRLWDATTGEVVASYAGTGSGPVNVSRSGLVTVTRPDQQIVLVIDTEPRGELGAAGLCDGSVGDGALAVTRERALVTVRCGGDPAPTTFAVDLASWRVSSADALQDVSSLTGSPDDASVVGQRHEVDASGVLQPGPLVVSDARTGVVAVELEDVPGSDQWAEASRLRWSPDGRSIAAAMGPRVAVWDAETGELAHVAAAGEAEAWAVDVIFSPDSSALIVTSSNRALTRRRLTSWEDAMVRSTTIDGADRIGLAGFGEDGDSLLAIGGMQSGGSTLARFDVETLTWTNVWPAIHEGAVTSATTSADGRRVATASTDGDVRVWDTATGALVHDAGRLDQPVRGVAFVGDDELLVAFDGGVERITIDPDRLLQLVRSSLTHGFTESECATYHFGTACPILDELRNRAPDEGAPGGQFRITWQADDLPPLMVADMERYYGRPVWDDPGLRRWLADLAAELAGTYTLRLEGRRFDLIRESDARPVCTGSIRFDAPRLTLLAERGSFCYPSVLFEGDVSLDDEGLRLQQGTLRAEFPTLIMFGTRPLERVR
jgi:DNA-binding SARP family transcriptional activator/WD40 repeat protein